VLFVAKRIISPPKILACLSAGSVPTNLISNFFLTIFIALTVNVLQAKTIASGLCFF